jgi:L-ascorbate metabolism protein UlaG (beta-lactamase superfamily)
MKIEWYGQAAFLITSDSGIRIITDPYGSNQMLTYDEINEPADIVTVSHDHFDHANVAAVKGDPVVIKESGEAKGVKFTAVATAHDDSGGSQRGSNTVYCFEVDGIKICHLGDLGHMLSDEQADAIGKVDILFIPVGGNFTIDAKGATEVANKLSPKVIIPMHYRNERCPSFPVAGVEDFIEGKDNVVKSDGSEAEYRANEIPDEVMIQVLNPSR